jgi:TPR repeat protein
MKTFPQRAPLMRLFKDCGEAAKLYRKATEKDELSGKYGLAMLYEHGRGVHRDTKRAMELYHEVATNNADAQRRLLRLYKVKMNIPQDKDKDKPIAWY